MPDNNNRQWARQHAHHAAQAVRTNQRTGDALVQEAPSSANDDLIRVNYFADLPDAAKLKPGRRALVKSLGWFLIVTAPEAWGGDSETDDNQWCPDSHCWLYPPGGVWPEDEEE